MTRRLRSGTFKRYESIGPDSVVAPPRATRKAAWSQIPHYLVAAPFGFGLGTAGSVSGFGGSRRNCSKGTASAAETQYNFLVKELGMLRAWSLWFALSLFMRDRARARRALRKVRDPETALLLVALCRAVHRVFFMAIDGAGLDSGVAAGRTSGSRSALAAYWFVGAGRRMALCPVGARPVADGRGMRRLGRRDGERPLAGECARASTC